MNGSEPIQQPLPLAYINGEALTEKPVDLFIPPDALEVFLDAFSGPMDLLLYLIRKEKVDIEHLPVLKLTQQYMEYIELMQELKLELAAEYLLMAAMLAEIKSRVLLPKPPTADVDEEDPRAELIRRLQEYELAKQSAEQLNNLPRRERDFWPAEAKPMNLTAVDHPPEVQLADLVDALQTVIKRCDAFAHHHISPEQLSTRARMSQVLERLSDNQFMQFASLFDVEEGKAGVVVTFLALLELSKEGLLEIQQVEPHGQIHVRRSACED